MREISNLAGKLGQSAQLDKDLLLNPGWDWDEAESEQPDSFPPGEFADVELTTSTVIAIAVKNDGTFKIIRRGHALAEADLEKLGCQPLAETIRDFHATSVKIQDMWEEMDGLEKSLLSLSQYLAYEPGLIQQKIKTAFPQGTAGKTVDIILGQNGRDYSLIVDGECRPDRVIREAGQAIVDQKNRLEKAREESAATTAKLKELQISIADSRQVLPLLEKKIRHLIQGLDQSELTKRLDGKLIEFTLNDQDQSVALVKREIDETLPEVPEEVKRGLLARHLAGRKLPEFVQKALGLEAAIEAINQVIGEPQAPPKIQD